MKTYINLVFTILLLSASATVFGQNGGNYQYSYKASCKCIVSKGNPEGIEQVSVFPYLSDPDIHEHGVGFYEKTAKTRVDTISLVDFSPKNFTCYPCMNFQPNTKYAFCFKGKDDLGPVTVTIITDGKGAIKEGKSR